jgi:hypothetical protein
MESIMKNVTLNKDGTPRKTGSGRKKGATSFVNVTIADLQQFCGNATVIPVSRVWLEQMGACIQGDNRTEISVSQAPAEEEQKISFTLHQ